MLAAAVVDGHMCVIFVFDAFHPLLSLRFYVDYVLSIVCCSVIRYGVFDIPHTFLLTLWISPGFDKTEQTTGGVDVWRVKQMLHFLLESVLAATRKCKTKSKRRESII